MLTGSRQVSDVQVALSVVRLWLSLGDTLRELLLITAACVEQCGTLFRLYQKVSSSAHTTPLL